MISSHPRRELMADHSGAEADRPRVSVVIPTLNEARNLPHVFARMPQDVHEVIVVDGHSVDDTVAVARQLWPGVRIVMQTRRGKGNALACGFAAATGDIIAMVDADGSADAGEIPSFVQALVGGADFAKGSRFLKGGGSSDITRFRRLGNRVLVASVNIVYRTKYTDLCYGFNAFWRHVVPVIGLDPITRSGPGDARLWGDGFEVETLVNIRVAKANLVISEVPSFESPRVHGVSNLNSFRDGLRVLRTILAERRQSRRLRERGADDPAQTAQTQPGVNAAASPYDSRIAADTTPVQPTGTAVTSPAEPSADIPVARR
jgi:glycosyltransferase involved in cell wall biosynthesis